MSAEKHTPGPWRIEGSFRHGDRTGFIISHGINSHGDGPQGYVGNVEVSKADALLIAAAPDMMAALQKWADYDALLRSLPGEGPLYCGQLAEVDAAYDACRDATDAAMLKAREA